MASVLDRDSQIESSAEPYLSLVVTARNDDHGGNLLRRMQIFVDGWLAQARRYQIPSELIVVEWNPPADRAPLVEALRWPADTGPCAVRFVEVPREIHARYKHAESLPLYQMIAKNVGIRRARGRFILATNIDILFSDELAAFLGSQQLREDRMYRIDRHDAMSDVPADAPIGEQLAYCRNHLIRVNRRGGTFEVAPDGSPVLSAVDVAGADSGIRLGDGWFSPEPLGPKGCFRWAPESAAILLDNPPQGAALVVDLEPGPATGGDPLDLSVVSGAGDELARVSIESRTRLRLTLPAPVPERLWLRAAGTFTSVTSNPRTLCFRVFGLAWDARENPAPVVVEPPPAKVSLRSAWGSLQYLITKLADGGPLVPVTIPVSPRLHRWLKAYVDHRGLTGLILGRKRVPEAPKAGTELEVVEAAFRAPEFLHTNGCGDFTLLAREHWLDLRGYPELDVFSMNIDSVFCFAAHSAGAREEVLAEPKRIYHIEHGSGSGWTPEGQKALFERIAAKGIPILDNELVLAWAAQMRRLDSPMIFNHEDWGLANLELKETIPAQPSKTAVAANWTGIRVKPRYHPAFDLLPPYTGPPEPGFEIDFLGIKTRCAFLAGAAAATMLSNGEAHEDYLEWIDLLESVLAAKGQYTVMELGAGYGRWSVRAAALIRQLRPMPFHLVAVEAEPRHYRWLQQHLSDNRVDPGGCKLIQGVVSGHREDVLFYVASPAGDRDEAASWYGQAIAKPYEAVDDLPTDPYEDQKVIQLRSGWKSIKVPSFLLTDILPEANRIDLIDMDLQGEEMKVIASSIDELDRRAVRLHIGTHSLEIEQGLRDLLRQHGWQCTADCAGGQMNQTPWGPIEFVDGVQSWVNPRLA